ncbi:amidohydrolase family protein [Allobranchiibius huperziae]|uniref:6-methylsalicylate decarboxylase n=1 Tax=Allobranchiibius huperziae TaxID=1874116 RepID=A0A853DCH8_9MICO|nr:amidohydrolase family protein [Allobranchiibius huperziae]NYJ75276.1 putative TIM-barrel fold metal-dependent hydrolase [Allobranchiibius huperziae]
MGAEPLIDVHSHFLTDDYISAARRAGIAQPDGTPQWPTWSEAAHLAMMDEHSIARSHLSISTPGVSFLSGEASRAMSRHLNEFAGALCEKRPDRFAFFATLPLDAVGEACAEAVRALDELGASGVAVETNRNGVYLADPSLAPLWQLLHDRSAVVFVHPTSPTNWPQTAIGLPRPMLEFLFDSARAAVDLVLEGVLDRFGDIDWIFTHSAGVLPLVVDRVQFLRRAFFPDAPEIDVVAAVSRLWFELAGTPFPRSAPIAADAFGSDRLLFGSDFCFTPTAGVAAQIASLDAARPVAGRSWRGLTTVNATSLFPAKEAQ